MDRITVRLDEDTERMLDEIVKGELARTRAEAIRFAVKLYHKKNVWTQDAWDNPHMRRGSDQRPTKERGGVCIDA